VNITCASEFGDLQRYLPCLSQACESVQRICMPKCGSVDRLTRKLKQMAARTSNGGDEGFHRTSKRRREVASAGQTLRRVGVEPITTAPTFGASPFLEPGSPPSDGSSTFPGDQMAQVLGELCTAVDCHVHCDKMPIIEKCGKAASVFSEDLLKTFFFTTLNEMITTFGFHHQGAMPPQCKAMIDESIAASNADRPTAAADQQPDVTRTSTPGSTGTTRTTSTTTDASITTNPTENQASTGRVGKATNGSMVAMPSLLMITILSFAFFKANRL